MSDTPTQQPSETRNWALACHLGGLAIFTGIPFGNILVPLVIWLLKRNADPFIDRHGRESLNFQVTMLAYGVVAFLLIFVAIGVLLLPVLLIADIVLMVRAAIAASEGRDYRYPFTLRLF
jgi:uncharacterized Tic20 family protein